MALSLKTAVWCPCLAKRCFTTSLLKLGKSASSQQWLNRQSKDPYVKRAQLESWRCRSAFKLLEIDDKYKIISPGDTVIDCGAAPGSWSQVAVQRVGADKGAENNRRKKAGTVISLDLLSIEPIPGAVILNNRDFTHEETQTDILKRLDGEKADVILSDMAPNASGVQNLDHERIANFCLSVLHFSTKVLKKDGHVLCKIWMGYRAQKLEGIMRRMFTTVKVIKPRASRSDSAEIYLLGIRFFGLKP